MRFMVIVKCGHTSEAGTVPSEEVRTAMKKFNDELIRAGVLVALEGLYPSSRGARVKFNGKERLVTDGPFTESKELVGGFWLWQCPSKESALEWLKKAPFDGGMEVELRQVFEPDDFAARFSPEVQKREERLWGGI
jgi:hypothetical protein